MRTKAEIEAKIKELENQKKSVVELSQIKGAVIFSDVVTIVMLLEKQIILLKWILS